MHIQIANLPNLIMEFGREGGECVGKREWLVCLVSGETTKYRCMVTFSQIDVLLNMLLLSHFTRATRV